MCLVLPANLLWGSPTCPVRLAIQAGYHVHLHLNWFWDLNSYTHVYLASISLPKCLSCPGRLLKVRFLNSPEILVRTEVLTKSNVKTKYAWHCKP